MEKMTTRLKWFGAVAVAAAGCVALAGEVWPESLWLGRGGYWTKRVALTAVNPSAEALEGRPVSVRVGSGKGELPLVGVRAEALRLVDARGVELLYGVRTADGAPLESGSVPAGAQLAIPVSAAAKGEARYWLYFDNPEAWGLADHLKTFGPSDVNGGFERGERTPFGWWTTGTDESHVLAWDGVVRATGAKALRAEASGAPNWFAWARDDLTVVPGSTCTVRVKVKTRDVKGYAGWFVHVGNDKNAMVVNKVIGAGGGTADWHPVSFTFKVPECCTKLSTGSSLWGTGTAWFDDFSFETDRPVPMPEVRVGAVESLDVKRLGEDDAPRPEAEGWDARVPLRVANFTDSDRPSALAAFSLREAVRGIRNPEWKVFAGAAEQAAFPMGSRVLFTCSVPARTICTFWLYVRRGRAMADGRAEKSVESALGSVIPSDQVLVARTEIGDTAAYARFARSAANLVRNPCFAEGETGWTHSGEKANSPVRYEVVKTGGLLGAGFAQTTIPVAEAGKWRGWYQAVPVRPGRRYLFGGFVSCDGATESVRIHMHAHAKNGKVTLMSNTGDAVAGTSPWTPTFGVYTAGADDATLQLHLTTCGGGTLRYDGLTVTEYLEAKPGELAGCPKSATDALAVEAVDPVVKVFRETAVRDAAGPFAVALARNETEPLQLAVRAPQAVGRLEVEVTPPKGKSGQGGIAVETGVVGYVPVDFATAYYNATKPKWELLYPTHSPSSDGWSGWWPDPILPTNVCTLAANETQAVWINLKTTAATRAGEYRGTIAWKVDGRTVRTDPYVVRVWNFALPAVAETPAIYDLRMGGRWAADLKGLTADERRRTFWKFYSEKRICPDTLGDGLRFTRGKDGRVTADFTDYDRRAQEYFDEFRFPVSYTPGAFYCFGWAMPPKAFLGEEPYEGKWPYDGADRSQLRSAYRQAYQEALRLYWNHVKAKGWDKRLVLYISDEPHFHHRYVREQMVALCRMIHEVDPAIRIYSSTWRHCPDWNGSLDVWGVGHYGCFPVDEMKARASAGGHVWFTTDGQMCLDTPYCAVERLLPHYCRAFDAEAYEFWGATWLTYDPWRYGWHSYIPQTDTPGKSYFVRYPDGDGYLIYPGVPGRFKGPVTSVRLEAARDGVEDFSYLKALERVAAGGGPRAQAAAALLKDFAALVTIPNAGGRYSTRILPEPELIGRLRRRAGELLDGTACSWERP